jgi:hypothetical protein
MEALQAFLNSPAGAALIAALVAAFADLATGTLAAIRDGTFSLDSIAAFLRKHIAGRVGPLGVLLLLGYYGGDVAGQLFMASAVAGLTAYAAETAASIWDNLRPSGENPVPED